MVRIRRLSFDEGMRIDLPVPRNSFDPEDNDDVIDEERPIAIPRRRKKKKPRQPDDRRPDRRQRAGDQWHLPREREGEGG